MLGAWVEPDPGVSAGCRLAMQLAEINLVMGIVKIALIVLAMVFSATPLPFESVATTAFLLWWSLGVAVLYFVASDFFHVARLVAYLDLWRREETAGTADNIFRDGCASHTQIWFGTEIAICRLLCYYAIGYLVVIVGVGLPDAHHAHSADVHDCDGRLFCSGIGIVIAVCRAA